MRREMLLKLTALKRGFFESFLNLDKSIFKMDTNCTELNQLGYWDNKQTGMSFNDDGTEFDKDGLNTSLVDINIIANMKKELHQSGDNSSICSETSETSSLSDDRAADLSELPDFLTPSPPSAEPKYEPQRAEFKLPTFKIPNIFSTPDDSRSFASSNIKITIQRLLLGQEVRLEGFRSFTDKKSLLTKAIEINDGNAIMAIVLFLQQTLLPTLFQMILLEYKPAANHYIWYLRTRSETAKLLDLLCMLGRLEDGLILRYKRILKSTNQERMKTQLKHFYSTECSNTDDDFGKLVTSHLYLIDTHTELRLKNQELFLKVGNCSSVMKTLTHLSEHYYDQDSSSLTSPMKFRITHNLTETQYGWACLLSLTKVKKWPQIQSLLIKKRWGSLLQEKSILPPEAVSEVLKEGSAPIDLISIFVSLIENGENKLNTAIRLKCHRVVIDIFAAKKDKSKILTYKSKLEEKSKDAVYAENVLKNIK